MFAHRDLLPSIWRTIPISLLAWGCSHAGGSAPPSPPPLPPSDVTIAENSPPAGAQSVPLSTPISIRFSAAVDPATVNASTFSLWLGASQIAGSVQCDGISATFVPAELLASSASYRALVDASIRDTQGLALGREFSWGFTIVDYLPPQLVSAEPANGEIFVAVRPTIRLQFSEPLDASSFAADRFVLRSAAGDAAIDVVGSQNRVTIVPSADLAEDQEYRVIALPGVVDLAQNQVAPFEARFRTTETVPPAVLDSMPEDGAENVSVDTLMTLRLSPDTDLATLIPANFGVRKVGSGDPIAFSVTVQTGTRPTEGILVTLTPVNPDGTTRPLPNSNTIEFLARSGIRDLAGNFMAADFSSRFTTDASVAGNPQKLEDADTTISDVANLRVAVAPNGSACAVWVQQTPTSPIATKHIYASIYAESATPGVWAWGAPAVISGTGTTDGNSASSPQVAAIPGTGEFVAVWQKNSPSDGQARVYWNRYVPGSGWQSFAQVSTVGNASAATLDPQVGVNVDTSDFYVAWVSRYSGTRTQIKGRGYAYTGSGYNALDIEDLSFTPTTSDTRSADSPRVVFDSVNNLVYAAWRERPTTSGKYSVRISAKEWDSLLGVYAPWVTSALVENDDTADVAIGDLAFDSRSARAFLLWRQRALTSSTTMVGDGFQSVYWDARSYTPATGEWSANASLSPLDDLTDRDAAGSPRLAIDAHPSGGLPRGTAMALWEYAAPAGGGNSKIFGKAYDPTGSWQTVAMDLDGGNTNTLRLPQIVNSENGKFLAAWKQLHSSGKFLIFGSSFDVASNSWAIPDRLENLYASETTPVVEDSDLPVLASNNNGKHAVVWIKTQGDPARKNAWANRFP